MNIKLRPATKADIPVIRDILTDGTHTKQAYDDDAWGTDDWTNDEVVERMAVKTFYLICQSDDIIGTFSLQWEDEGNWGPMPPDAGYLHSLAIKDDFHGQNIGVKAIDLAAQEVAKKGRKFLRLDCPAANKSLCAYYENQGFTKVAERLIPQYGHGYVAALYERII